MHSKSSFREIVAPNPSAMTLDGTRTFVIGRERAAIIDPGPHSAQHLNAVAEAIGDGVVVCVLLTHMHPDHAEGAQEMAKRFETTVRSFSHENLRDGEHIITDSGLVQALATPGHTPDHASFYLENDGVVFCGDLMMGGMDTALVARPEGDLAHYLESLRMLAELEPKLICPAHGPAFTDPQAAIANYIAHREERLAQVARGMSAGARTADQLLDIVYGPKLDPRLRPYAEASIHAYIHYLKGI